MSDWLIARETIQSALKSRQIGDPVAVRLVAHLSADHGGIESLAAQALQAAVEWLGGESPDRLTARGGAEAGQITVLARLPAGQTVLVSAGSCGVGLPLMQASVFGNRGMLTWEDDDIPLRRSGDGTAAPLSPVAMRLQHRIREALQKSSTNTTTNTDAKETSTAPVAAVSDSRLRPLSPPYGVLLIAGDHTHQPGYAATLAADKRCRLIGLSDESGLSKRRLTLNERLANSLAIPLLPDLDAALRRPDVHIVSLCAEPMRRGRLIEQVARAGKHMYLDKPLVGTLADVDRVLAAVKTAPVVAHMFSQVHSTAASRVRDMVQSGRLGDLTAIHFDMCFAKGHGGGAKLGQPRRETAVPDEYEVMESKREMTNIGVYPLVLLQWMLGRKVQSVAAVTGNFFFEENQRNNMEDFGQMLLEVEGGLTVTITAGRTGWRSHALSGLNRVCLIGKKQCAVIDGFRPRVEVWADVEPWTAPKRDPEDPMGMWGTPSSGPYAARPKQSWIGTPDTLSAADATHFLDCVEQGRPCDVSASLAAAVTEILLAGYRSAATGDVVALPLPRNS